MPLTSVDLNSLNVQPAVGSYHTIPALPTFNTAQVQTELNIPLLDSYQCKISGLQSELSAALEDAAASRAAFSALEKVSTMAILHSDGSISKEYAQRVAYLEQVGH
jgi:hypothetical protein